MSSAVAAGAVTPAATAKSEPNVVTLDGSLLEAGGLDLGQKPPMWGGLGSVLSADRAFDGGGSQAAGQRGTLPTYVRFGKAHAPQGNRRQETQEAQAPASKGRPSKQALGKSSVHLLLTPPTVSGFSCAPKQEWLAGLSLEDRDDATQSVFASTGGNVSVAKPMPAKGLINLVQHALPRSPFRCSVEGMSVTKLRMLASLNTKFSEDFISKESPAKFVAFRPDSTTSSSTSSDLLPRKNNFVTVLGYPGEPATSAGPWWSPADLHGLPQDSPNRSSGFCSEDGRNSEYSWSYTSTPHTTHMRVSGVEPSEGYPISASQCS